MAMDFSWLPQGTAASGLPLGMRVNNPGNIKYFRGLNYPGMLGPSQHTDQGDPQMTFDTPQSGMNAASSLALRKYRGGMRTPMSIVSGKMGWTPGNIAAAQNIARNMGIGPNDDLGLDDPTRLATFLRALTRQEHGGSSSLYGDDLYSNAATAAVGASPAQRQAAMLRQRFNAAPVGTKTEGGVTAPAPTQQMSDPTERLKAALGKSYDPDRIVSAESLRDSGQKIAGSSGNALGAIGGTILAGLGAHQRGEESERKKAHDAALSEALLNSAGAKETIGALLGSSNPEHRKAGMEMLIKSQESKPQEWASAGDGFVMNKATGETRPIQGYQKTTQPTELERRAVAGGLKPGTPEYESYILGGPPKSKTEKWNEGQSKAANFGNMMTKAEGLIAGMGPKDAAGKPMVGPDGQPLPAENPKGIGGVLRDSLLPFEGLRNTLTPNDQQTYNQAAEQWIRAKLRKESGAAIGDEEMAKEFKTYFPQYGDGPDVLKQKADARAEATRGMIAESAGAYQHFFGGEKGAGENGGDIDRPRPVRTQTIDPTTGQPRQDASAPASPRPVAPPTAAIGKLLQNPTPEMQSFFDQKYGAGAAARALEAQKTQPPAQGQPQPFYGEGLY